MFEDENWDISEDDLKDFNSDDIFNDNSDKSQNLLSTKSVDTTQTLPVLSNVTELKCRILEIPQNQVNLQSNDSVSQRNVVLDIFNRNSKSQEVLQDHQQNTLVHENEKPLVCKSNVTSECRKNLILNVFQENITKPKCIVKSSLKISDTHFHTENKFKRKKNVAFVDVLDETNAVKKVCTEIANKSEDIIMKDVQIDKENSISSSSESNAYYISDTDSNKKQMLIDSINSPLDITTKVPRVKHTIVRKFPGPAGILPDDINECNVVDLDVLEKKKNKKRDKYADVCSQNTKNLFTTGAWQLMMDDLPADFELYDIATIKENALQYSKTYKKVPYLAGIIQYIDYKPNDPHIVLKDLSGKVDARIHHSICKLYPNALGTSIVILAKDVGLIVTSKKFVCIIISLNNLVSIYSDDVRLVETSHLKMLLKNENSSHNLNESQISILDESGCHDDNEVSKTDGQEITNNFQEQCRSVLKNDGNIEKLQDINAKNISELKIVNEDNDKHKKVNVKLQPNYDCDKSDFNFDEDDSWLGVNIDELNSFTSHQFPSSTPMPTLEKASTGVCVQTEKSTNIMSKSLNNLPVSKQIMSGTKQSCSTNCNNRTILDKLLPFRNTNHMTKQLTISNTINSTENMLVATNKKRFECESNDTDDEMLSQLDVDAIAASYTTQNS